MSNPQVHMRARLTAAVAAGAMIVGLFPMAGVALAAGQSVTPATGGGAIPLDKTTGSVGPVTGTGEYTTLVGPVINEGDTAGTFTAGTIVLTAPAGFEFDPSSGLATRTGSCTLSGLSMTTATATVTIVAVSTTTPCVITFSGLRVRPTITAPTTGDITRSGTATGLPGGSYGALAAVPGTPILTFVTQPSITATAGTPFGQQPVVTSLDRFSNPRVADNVTLSVRPGTGTAGGVVVCTTNPVATNGSGVATFAGCRINTAGTNYQLRASVSTPQGSAAVDSTLITVNPGTPIKLGFVTQPGRGVPNVALTSQPVVAIQDAFDNTVPVAHSGITLAIKSGTGAAGAVLTCTANPLPVPGTGFVTFSGCRIDRVGVGYRLTASAGATYAAADSNLFDVVDRLAFTVQPSGAVGGVPFTVQPQVTVRAGASAPAVNDNVTVVTLSIKPGTGASGAVLSCTSGLSRTVVAGIAAFSGCSIDKSSPTGNPYVLVATSPGLASAESATLAVVAGPASKLLFTIQPTNTNVNVPFVSPVTVSITDAGGNVVTTGADSTRTVTLAIGTNPGGGTLTCSSGLSRAAVAGVATFSGCSINRAGVGYTLVATTPGLTSATSNAFNVTAPAAVMTLIRSTGMIAVGQTATLSVQFAANGAGRTVFLEWTYAGFPWTAVASGTTNSNGFASLTAAPNRSGYYRVRFDGAPDLSAAYSNVVLVGVRQTIALNPSHSGTLTIAQGRSITFRGTVRPTRPDGVASRVTFRFFERRSGTWVLRYERRVATDLSGTARTTFRFGVKGNWYVMAFAETTPYNAVSRFSQREYFLVR